LQEKSRLTFDAKADWGQCATFESIGSRDFLLALFEDCAVIGVDFVAKIQRLYFRRFSRTSVQIDK
jgi:hypothetical protein